MMFLEKSDFLTNEKLVDGTIKIIEGKVFEIMKNDYLDCLLKTFEYIMESLRSHFNDSSYQRFLQFNKDSFLEIIHVELTHKKNKTFPSIEEFIPMRRKTAGLNVCFTLTEISRNVNPNIFNDKRVQTLIDLANDHVSWVNDIYSAKKEENIGLTCNYVLVAEKELNLNRENANSYVFGEIEKVIAKFNEIYQIIKSEFNNKDLINFVDGLIDWMNGHVEWYECTKRYAMSDSSLDYSKSLELECYVDNFN
jgi:Terpene synthase family 2, C-terminal metal binding